jgi:hypothetical protein
MRGREAPPHPQPRSELNYYVVPVWTCVHVPELRFACTGLFILKSYRTWLGKVLTIFELINKLLWYNTIFQSH